MPSREACLSSTAFIDCEHPQIAEKVVDMGLWGLSEAERAIRLFDWVRDQVQYEWMAKGQPEAYVASNVLATGRGFCVQKSLLLCALGRAAGIPTALVLSDMQDFQLPRRYPEAMGHNVIFYHGLVAFHLEGRWLKVDPALSPDVVRLKRFRPVRFDGHSDALHAETTLDGAPHAGYLRFHGLFADLPFARLIGAYTEAYANKPMQVFDPDH